MSVKKFGLDPDGELGLSEDDVVSVYGSWFGLKERMTKLSEMMSFLSSWGSKDMRDTNPWFTEKGGECEILRTKGGGWQKGRFRIRLEFVPDDPKSFFKDFPREDDKPQSPLADLRSQLDTQ
ncbi:MAG: KGK domain-containing protein [Nostoc sp. DedQUE05]|uniref:KGK domain-containing protein n=1 Tax=Nostoc sp. DedQUE05 TaxID=3075391 RepID=UPI002AD317B4|nr:KGK domain-containing protein [Nostoc sp. DedQUE05]MDZ8096705.1 KGK domain-containing protein [Nostoc sp. DedQUE05]